MADAGASTCRDTAGQTYLRETITPKVTPPGCPRSPLPTRPPMGRHAAAGDAGVGTQPLQAHFPPSRWACGSGRDGLTTAVRQPSPEPQSPWQGLPARAPPAEPRDRKHRPSRAHAGTSLDLPGSRTHRPLRPGDRAPPGATETSAAASRSAAGLPTLSPSSRRHGPSPIPHLERSRALGSPSPRQASPRSPR